MLLMAWAVAARGGGAGGHMPPGASNEGWRRQAPKKSVLNIHSSSSEIIRFVNYTLSNLVTCIYFCFLEWLS